MNGPLFAYDTARQALVICDISGKPLGGIPLKVVQEFDPTATHEKFTKVLPRPDTGGPRIITGGPIPRGLDSKLRRG